MGVKKIFLLALLLLSGFAGLRAQSISYAYDASGNRVTRAVVLSQAKAMVEDTETAVNEVWQDMQVTVSGNPSLGHVDVAISGANAADLSKAVVSVFTLSGQVLQSASFSSSGHAVADFSRQPAGVYALRIRCGRYDNTWRITKK